jgi:hypothetical protein
MPDAPAIVLGQQRQDGPRARVGHQHLDEPALVVPAEGRSVDLQDLGSVRGGRFPEAHVRGLGPFRLVPSSSGGAPSPRRMLQSDITGVGGSTSDSGSLHPGWSLDSARPR